MGDPTEKPEFSDSTRKLLDEIADEKHHQDWLRARRKRAVETIRGWVTWLTAIWVLKGLLWDSFTTLARDHLK